MERPLDLGRVVGTTFTPSVDASGNLSWTNDGGLTNPATVNIKGPPGSAANACKLGGPVTFATLPALTADNAGLIVNVSDAFTTTNDFLGGSGTSCPAGTNVIIVALKTVAASGDFWTLYSDGQLFISGDGDLWDAPEPWIDYASQITSVILQDGITATGYNAFCFNAFATYENLTSVYLPVSLVDVIEGAFGNLDNLTDVYYSGTQAQWENVNINLEGSEPFYQATIHYESAPPSETSYYKYNVLSGAVDLSGYVRKETGKGLSTNDYATADKNKLAGIASGATANVAATAVPLMDGTAAVGSATKYAREDHVHPVDTSRASSVDMEKVIALLSNAVIYRHASGDVVHFYDGYPDNLRKLVVTIQPTLYGCSTVYVCRYNVSTQKEIAIPLVDSANNNATLTVYGGILDVIKGLLTVTHARIIYDGETPVPDGWISSTDELSTGALVVYPLAVTDYEIYTLTGQNLDILSGQNAVFASHNLKSSVEIEYRADTAVALS